jgi:uncharacterized protein (DUF169 family)
MDLAMLGKALETYVRIETSPVAVKVLTTADDIPERSRMPLRDFGVTMPFCQGVALARRHGLVVAMGRDDMLCPLGAVATGLLPAKEGFLDGRFGTPFWAADQEAVARFAQYIPRLEYGRYTHVVMAPIERTAFEPDVIVVYGNPAQVGRMVQAAVHVTGQPLRSESIGGVACAEQIARTMLTGLPQTVVMGGGERVLALTQDHEASFALPAAMADAFAAALEETHKRGARYPTRSWLTFGATMPPNFTKMLDYLKEDADQG